MRSLFLLMILAAMANSALGQTQTEVQKCSLSAAQSPTIRGLRLGMGVEEVLSQFPGKSGDPTIRTNLLWGEKNFGHAKFSVPTPSETGKHEGIYQFDLEFLDNRLAAFGIQYKGPEWKNVDEFIARISESLSLPAANFWTPSNLATVKTLNCTGFEVRVFLGGSDSNYLQVRIAAMEQILADRRTEAKEKARKDFKP